MVEVIFLREDMSQSEMNRKMNRRKALATGFGAFASVGIIPGISFAQSTVHDAIPSLNKDNSPDFRGCRWTVLARNQVNQNRFTQKQQRRAIEALRICLCHMLNPKYLSLALEKMRNFYTHTTFNLPNKNRNDFDRSVRHQFQALRDHGFVRVTIDPWNENANILGSAYVKNAYQVTPIKRIKGGKHQGYDYKIKGSQELKNGEWVRNPPSFNIFLNGNALEEETPRVMAGTVAHEILHQMGHMHSNGYTDDNFITVFGDIVRNEGKFISRANGFDVKPKSGCPFGKNS